MPDVPDDYWLRHAGVLTEEEDDTGWIPHDGGPCPVAPDKVVQAWSRNGVISLDPNRASGFDWHKVKKYRVLDDDLYDEPPLVDATDTRPPHARLNWAEDAPGDIPPPLDDAWILHNGGPRSVPPDTLVWVDNGTGAFRGPAPASAFEWVDGEPERVHSYRRVVDPDAPTDHYRQGGIECIDAIRAALTDEEWRGYCKGNVLKYTWREKHKGGDGSLLKAQDYLRWALAGKAEDKR